MTKLEKMAEDYVDPLSADFDEMPYSPHVSNLLEKAYMDGFLKARAIAEELVRWNASVYRGNATGMVLTSLRDIIVTIGDSDAERASGVKE